MNKNPILRTLIVVLGGIVAMLGILFAVIAIMILIPLSIPFHIILVALGRKGFIKHHKDGTFSYEITIEGFHSAERFY